MMEFLKNIFINIQSVKVHKTLLYIKKSKDKDQELLILDNN